MIKRITTDDSDSEYPWTAYKVKRVKRIKRITTDDSDSEYPWTAYKVKRVESTDMWTNDWENTLKLADQDWS